MSERLVIGSVANERVGPVWVALSVRGLVGVHMRADEETVRAHYRDAVVERDDEATEAVCAQLAAYFQGSAEPFGVTIDWQALGEFQRQVLQRVMAIPYGQTRSYQEIAEEIGQPRAARAVGRANATNPMPLIVPCHRVLGSDGKLHGYGGPGGVETKAWLLALEGSRLL